MGREGKNKKIEITSELKNLAIVREFVKREAKEFGFESIDVEKIVLAVDEACTNSIKHSYRNKPDGKICVKIKKNGKKFTIIISYDGVLFDLTRVRVQNPIEKAIRTGRPKRGKLGMFIIHTFMDEVKYRQRRGLNEVILTKILR